MILKMGSQRGGGGGGGGARAMRRSVRRPSRWSGPGSLCYGRRARPVSGGSGGGERRKHLHLGGACRGWPGGDGGGRAASCAVPPCPMRDEARYVLAMLYVRCAGRVPHTSWLAIGY